MQIGPAFVNHADLDYALEVLQELIDLLVSKIKEAATKLDLEGAPSSAME